MIAKSHPETSDNTRKNTRQKKKQKNNKWTQMNCLNYELSQNLNRMYTNKNVCPFDVSSSTNQVLSLEYVLTHSMQCFVYLQHFPAIDSISLLKLSLAVPKAPTTTATTFVLTFHVLEISICRSLYFNPFTSSGTATSTIKQFCSFLLRIIKSGLFARSLLILFYPT